jgi:hypothetical protein
MPPSSKSRVQPPGSVTINFSDSIRTIRDQVHWTPKGVRLLTKWRFEEGTELEFAFDHHGERHCHTGVVVACHALRRPPGCYELHLYFIETPCTRVQKAACDCQLASERRQMARDETHFTTTNQALDGGEKEGASRAVPRRRGNAAPPDGASSAGRRFRIQ